MRTLLIACAVLACAWPIAAQEAARLPETPHPFGRLKLGVLSITPNVQLFDVGMDTNVFDLAGTERRAPDFTATVGPSFEFRVLTRRLDVRFVERLDYVYYQRYASERSLNRRHSLVIEDRVNSRLTLYGTGSLDYTRARDGLEVDARERHFSQSALVGARLHRRKLELDVHGAFSDLAFDEQARFLGVPLAQTLNHTSRGGGATLSYRLTSMTSIAAGSDVRVDHFPNAPDRDLTALTTNVGFQFQPRAMISGSAGIAYRRVEPRSDRTPGFAGVGPQAGISYRLHDFLTLSVGAERNVDYSFYSDRPYYVYDLYEGSIRQAIMHRFDIGASFQYTTLGYRMFSIDGVPLPPPPNDTLRVLAASVSVPLGRQIRIGWYVQQSDRLSVDRPYQDFRSGLEMSLGRARMNTRGVFLHGPGR